MTLLNNILPEQRRGKLKALLETGKIVRVLEAHNGLSGIIANMAEVTGEYRVSETDHQVQRDFGGACSQECSND